MIRPNRRRIIPISTEREQLEGGREVDGDDRRFQSSSVRRTKSVSRVRPALLTRMSRSPIAASAAGHQRVHGRAVGEIAGRTWTRSPSSAASAIERLAPCPGDPDRRALLVERAGDAAADRAARAGDQGLPAAQIEHAIAPSPDSHASRATAASMSSGVPRRQRLGTVGDPLGEARQHLARADLDEGIDARAGQVDDRLAPAHHARHLRDQIRAGWSRGR